MFHNLSPAELVFVGIGAISLYVVIIAIAYGKKLIGTWGRLVGSSMTPAVATPRAGSNWEKGDHFPPLIDKPADHPEEQARSYGKSEDGHAYYESDPEDDEGFTTLLKEAEKVVERIQFVVEHIQSRPANPEEVKSKLKALVSQYRIFVETEYYEAINSFIAITVERDCDITLEEEDLHDLWTRQAA